MQGCWVEQAHALLVYVHISVINLDNGVGIWLSRESYFLPDACTTHHRVIPPPAILLERFDLVNGIYGGLLDKKTKQPLLRPEAWDAVNRLRVHIKAGCLSDPHAVPLYFEAGRDSATGCSLYRCVRGTNDLEGYHLHMRLLAAWCISPKLAHLLLTEHNYRWNLRQAVKNRGLDLSVGGFYNQAVLEAVQVSYLKKL